MRQGNMGAHTSQANNKLAIAQTKLESSIARIITKRRFREGPASRRIYEVLEETGAGQENVDTACSGVVRKWRRADRSGHSMLRCWHRLELERQMWIQHAQTLEETGTAQADVNIACSGVGRHWHRTGRCGYSMLKCWKRVAQDRQMWTQHAQVLEETGEGQADVDTSCSSVGREWHRTGRCGHSMLMCWKRLKQYRQLWSQHAEVLEEIGEGQADVDTAC